MGHSLLRSEKDCLNCGTHVPDRYCPHCGQENIVPRQTFFSLVTHFVSDILHFDGKFWSTLRYLLLRPGFVPREFVLGRRASFLDPIRMYLFTSAIFFFVFFALFDLENAIIGDSPEVLTARQRLGQVHALMDTLERHPEDTVLQKQVNDLLDTTRHIRLIKDTTDTVAFPVQIDGVTYRMDPRARNLPSVRTNSDWMDRIFSERFDKVSQRADGDTKVVLAQLTEVFLHRLPYMLFISLPLFAGILMLVNYRRRMLYSEHAIFTLYHYIFAFILLMVLFGINELGDVTGWSLLNGLSDLMKIYIFVYLLLGMKHFYRQGWLRTAFKFVAVNLLAGIMLMLVFSGFLILTLIF